MPVKVQQNARPARSNTKSVATDRFFRDEKGESVRHQNIVAAQTIANAVRTSLGPKGMDKMIQDSSGDVIVTNDGATILKQVSVAHPAARMFVEMSKAQDIEAGDGTTTVVVIAGALLDAANQLLNKNLHPQTIAESFLNASHQAARFLKEAAIPVDLENYSRIVQAATTTLSSKVVSQNAKVLAPMAVDAVFKVWNDKSVRDIDLRNIRIMKKLGGTIDDTEIVNGIIFTDQKVSRVAGGPRRIENAKIGLIQFCLSPPKTDMDNSIVINDYQSMDRIIKEERLIIASMIKQIAATGCNVLLIQKSILRDAVTDLSLDFLAKANILAIRDIERSDIDFISKTLGCQPVASIDHFTGARLGSASLVYDEPIEAGGRITRISGTPGKQTVSILVRASNNLMLDEIERSLHDALCAVRSLVRVNAMTVGGGAIEMYLSTKLREWARQLSGVQSICVQAYAEAFEIIPYTLAQNAAMQPAEAVTQLRAQHLKGNHTYGIDVKEGHVKDMKDSNVFQPLLVSLSAVQLATETVTAILKIDDVVLTR